MQHTYNEQLKINNSKNYIPKEIYVSRQPRGDSDEILGFMIPHQPTVSTYDSRKVTCDSWAGKNNTPLIFKNEFRSGFSIIKQVARSGGQFSSDVVYWRVLHPEGFEFEITSENFEEIIVRNVIDCGFIMNSEMILVFNRSSRKWHLTDSISQDYKEAKDILEPGSSGCLLLEKNAKAELAKSKSELQVGDIITIMNDRTHYKYLGNVSCAIANAESLLMPPTFGRYKVLLYNNTYMGRYELNFVSDIKVDKTIESTHMTVQDGINDINTILQQYSFNNKKVTITAPANKMILGVFDKKPKTYEFKKTPVTTDMLKLDSLINPSNKHDRFRELPTYITPRCARYNIMIYSTAMNTYYDVIEPVSTGYNSKVNGMSYENLLSFNTKNGTVIISQLYIAKEQKLVKNLFYGMVNAREQNKKNQNSHSLKHEQLATKRYEDELEKATQAHNDGWLFDAHYEMHIISVV